MRDDRLLRRQAHERLEILKAKATEACARQGHTLASFSGRGVTAVAECVRCDCNVVIDINQGVFAGPGTKTPCGGRSR